MNLNTNTDHNKESLDNLSESGTGTPYDPVINYPQIKSGSPEKNYMGE